MMRIKSTWQDVKNRYQQFSLREQRMVLVGIGALSLYLLYALIAMPILNHLTVMRKQVTEAQTLLAWMQGADHLIAELKQTEHTRTRPESLVALLSTLKQNVKTAGLDKSLAQLRQAGGDSIELRFENVNFDQAIRFIISLIQEIEVHIAQFSVTSLGKPGMTNIDIVMKVSV